MRQLFRRTLVGATLALAALAAQAANPQVALKTNLGTIVVELYPQKAPKTVENFLQYVKSGFYKDTVFHRVVRDFVVQGGGFTPRLEAKSTALPIPLEANNGLKNEMGTVAMARAYDPNSATSQFFFNLSDNKHLNFFRAEPGLYGYTVFGKIIQGLDIAKQIGTIPTTAQGPFPAEVPVETVVLQDAVVLEDNTAKSTSKRKL